MGNFIENPEKAYATYLDRGYYIEPAMLTADECENLIQAAEQLPNARIGTYRPQMMPHRQNQLYLIAMKKPKMLQIMEKFLKGKPVGLQTELFYCKPGTRGFSLHQDNFFVEAPYDAFVSAWIPLTDTYPDKGGLIVYPQSHREAILPIRKLNYSQDSSQDPNANNEETVVPRKYIPMHLSIPKGAALFIHGHLVHGSNPNRTDEWRHVLLNTFIRMGASFRPGNYAQREVILL